MCRPQRVGVGDCTCSPPLCAGLGALRSPCKAAAWKQSGGQQFAQKRAQEQAGQAVDGSREGQVELECEAVENSMGDLWSGAALIGGHILGRDDRAQQTRGMFDPVVRLPQATLALDQRRKSLSIRRLNRLQLSEKPLFILSRRDAVKALRRCFTLGNLLPGATHQLQERRLVLACDSRRLHQQQRSPEGGG